MAFSGRRTEQGIKFKDLFDRVRKGISHARPSRNSSRISLSWPDKGTKEVIRTIEDYKDQFRMTLNWNFVLKLLEKIDIWFVMLELTALKNPRQRSITLFFIRSHASYALSCQQRDLQPRHPRSPCPLILCLCFEYSVKIKALGKFASGQFSPFQGLNGSQKSHKLKIWEIL